MTRKIVGVLLILLAIIGMVVNKFMVFESGFLSKYWWLIFGIPIVLFTVLHFYPGNED